MRKGIVSIGLYCICCFMQAEALPRYWLIQEDFIKLGKKELYEEEKKKELDKKRFEVVLAKDLENPQYVFLMPLKDLSDLEKYPPIQEEAALVSTCLNYQIFSLAQLLPKGSFQSELCFSAQRPYLSYILYDIYPGSETSFQDHLEKLVAKQAKKSSSSWNSWKVLLGGDAPKYLLCTSFMSKEELKNAKLDELFEEASIKDIIRDKKSGWMKNEPMLLELKK